MQSGGVAKIFCTISEILLQTAGATRGAQGCGGIYHVGCCTDRLRDAGLLVAGRVGREGGGGETGYGEDEDEAAYDCVSHFGISPSADENVSKISLDNQTFTT